MPFYNGKQRSYRAICEPHNINVSSLQKACSAHPEISIDDHIARLVEKKNSQQGKIQRYGKRAKLYPFKGRQAPLSVISKEINVSIETLRYWVKKHGYEKAILMRPQVKHRAKIINLARNKTTPELDIFDPELEDVRRLEQYVAQGISKDAILFRMKGAFV